MNSKLKFLTLIGVLSITGFIYGMSLQVSAKNGENIVVPPKKSAPTIIRDLDRAEKIRQDPPSSSQNQDILNWEIRDWTQNNVREKVSSWATKYYQQPGQVFGNLDPDVMAVSTPKGRLVIKDYVEFDVIHIPHNEGRLKQDVRQREQKDPLLVSAQAIFEDEDSSLYAINLESRKSSPNILTITSVGPVIDRKPLLRDLPLKTRHLKSNSPSYIGQQKLEEDSKLVTIPYPYAAEQIYMQHGTSLQSASFEDLTTGKKYENLASILAETDKQWESLNSESVQ
jgi:hypothetical protein